jgi:RHS repeat-associated protein
VNRRASCFFLLAALLWLGCFPALAIRPQPLETRVGGWEPFASGQTSGAGWQSPENAMGLRACAYKTASGRLKWLNQDPMGENGGINLYQFDYNNPLSYIDPTGKAPQLTSVTFNLNTGQSSAGYTPYQFGQGYGIGFNGPDQQSPIGAFNDMMDQSRQQLAQDIANQLGLGNNPQDVNGIDNALGLVQVGMASEDCPTKYPKLGWSGTKPYFDALNKLRQGGPRVDLGFIPTQQQALQLLQDAGVDLNSPELRIEGPHAPPNPHDYPHINYPTPSGGKGTIQIQ